MSSLYGRILNRFSKKERFSMGVQVNSIQITHINGVPSAWQDVTMPISWSVDCPNGILTFSGVCTNFGNSLDDKVFGVLINASNSNQESAWEHDSNSSNSLVWSLGFDINTDKNTLPDSNALEVIFHVERRGANNNATEAEDFTFMLSTTSMGMMSVRAQSAKAAKAKVTPNGEDTAKRKSKPKKTAGKSK